MSRTMRLQDLPPVVNAALQDLGRKAAREGIRVFVFGSFARGDARPTSDLDLGFEVVGEEVTPEAVHWLRAEVENLPTIRPVDLVDFREVSAPFRALAALEVIPLGS